VRAWSGHSGEWEG